MRTACSLLLALAFVTSASAQNSPGSNENSPNQITIEAAPLGDTEGGVVTRITLRLQLADTLPPETPLVIQGSLVQAGRVLRNFRYELRPDQRDVFSFISPVPAGVIDVEARLFLPLEKESTPMMLSKETRSFTINATGNPYVAGEGDGPEGIIAEGVVPEVTGSVKILPPRRNLAPNLFTVSVDTKPPVARVEFYVEGKKIFTKNAPPFSTELDLGNIPKRVEVKVVGYDRAGRYVDADAWIVNERETPLEIKITRTVTPDQVSHFKLSIQNPKNLALKTVALFAGDKKLIEWSRPPYAFDIANALLAGVRFVKATAVDETNYEAADLLFLDGSTYSEQIEVNLVELPIAVVDASGVPIADLKKEDFKIFEDRKPQKITNFGFSSDLPVSVGVLVDHSGSMQPRIEAARRAAIEFFRQIITPRDRAFFGAFAWDPSSISPFVSNVEALATQVDEMPAAEGGTALYDAIVSGLYKFRTVSGRKALIIVTDGEDTTSRLSYDDMIQYVRTARVPIYFIGIGISGIDFSATSKMRGLAAETGGVAYFIKNADALKDTYKQLETELRSQYLLAYYAESTKNDSRYRTVEVQVDRAGAKVRTIRGYIP